MKMAPKFCHISGRQAFLCFREIPYFLAILPLILVFYSLFITISHENIP